MWNKDFIAAINFPGLHLFDAAGPGVVVLLSARRWSPLISGCGVMGLPCISRFAFNDPIDRTAYSNRESAPNYLDLIYLGNGKQEQQQPLESNSRREAAML